MDTLGPWGDIPPGYGLALQAGKYFKIASSTTSHCHEFHETCKGVGGWAMAGVQGKVAFGLRHICILSFSKKA